jgi:two-component system, NtrC family, nitrogen regulation sensor histidine kinase NtrY
MRLSTRILLAVAFTALSAFVLAFALLRVARIFEFPESFAWMIAIVLTIPVVLWSAGEIHGYISRAITSLDDGLRAFRDGDFSMRLAAPPRDEVTAVKRLYNDVADLLRSQRTDVYQKELVLDTILQRTPMAVVLVDTSGRVAYSNTSARELLADGKRLDGQRFVEVRERLAIPMRDALANSGDAIVTVRTAEQDETFHLTQRTFRLNTLEHRLVLIERLTSELRRQEVAVWKKAIRVINHELNNTIAPISSLFHSAKLAQSMQRHDRLAEIYETIEERLAFLRNFLESYAQFARIPPPKPVATTWQEIVDDVHALYEFRAEGELKLEVIADRAQMQQVLINLVKNAHESGSAPDDIVVSVQRNVDGMVVRVSDRGAGMPDEVLRQALVPFYTTKPAGSGLGLALCSEIIELHGGRMRLQSAKGEGTVVTCWLPATPS